MPPSPLPPPRQRAPCTNRFARAAPPPARGWRCRPIAAAWSASAMASSTRGRRAARPSSSRLRRRPRGWCCGGSRGPRRRRSRRGPGIPGTPATSKPSPIATALIAWIERIACPRRPSSRSSQDTWDPRPGTSPNARTSNTPPERLVRLAQPVDLGDHRRGRLGVQAANRRLVDRTRNPPAPGRRGAERSRAVIWITCENTSTPSSRRNAFATAPPATRAAVSRALARSRMSRTSVSAVLLGADEIRVPGPRQVHLRQLRLHRPRVHPLLPVGVVPVDHLERDRPAQRPPMPNAAGDLAPGPARSSSVLRVHAPADAGRDRG